MAAFTAANGMLTLLQPDVMILAGLVVPFVAQSTWAHFAAAAALGVVGYFGQTHRSLFTVALAAYVLDAAFAAYLQLWSGVLMHVVVLAFVGLALNGARVLEKQHVLGAQQAVAADRAKTGSG